MAKVPVIEERAEQTYAGKRTVMPMRDFARAIPALTDHVSEWIKAHGLQASGKPFLRYHVIDMPERLDVELGIPVDVAPDAEGSVQGQVLPAGRYAVFSYTGVKNGIPANKQLIEWIGEQGEAVASHGSEQGEVFTSRYETFLTDPEAGAGQDQDGSETEVAIKLRD